MENRSTILIDFQVEPAGGYAERSAVLAMADEGLPGRRLQHDTKPETRPRTPSRGDGHPPAEPLLGRALRPKSYETP